MTIATPGNFFGSICLLVGLFANIWILVKSGELARAARDLSELGKVTFRERFQQMLRMSELACRGEFSSVGLALAVIAPWTAILLFSIG